MLVITEKLSIPLRELTFRYSRSPGPGGQNVNKVNTKVMLRWPVAASQTMPETVCQRIREVYHRRVNKNGELVLTSSRFRDQSRNVEDCLEKLRELVREVASPPRTRRVTRPTRASIRRRKKDKQRQSQKKSRRKPPRGEDFG
ncbi:MAG: alternative ribosome rescue aminoacyl-tRNA hydrolase ArfB [Pirellulaceae bacterium]|jgi:ribosome-associated protein|nr:alternative ribosome rescue aminoacyl-tRNA hydrolase ArfB [Pirellulaceae bacterium]